jgi:hypothetical protein
VNELPLYYTDAQLTEKFQNIPEKSLIRTILGRSDGAPKYFPKPGTETV